MIQRCNVILVGFILWLMPLPAKAHGVLKGVGDFYAGLLHPAVVPAELIAVVATGLLLGGSGVVACRWGIVILAGGVAMSLALASAPVITPGATPLLLAAALIAAGAVTAGLRPPNWLAAAVAAFAGLAVGIDAVPETKTNIALLTGAAATVLGSAILATIVSALVVGAESHWHRIAARIAASWIVASAMLYLTWHVLVITR